MPNPQPQKCLVQSCQSRKIKSRGLCAVDYGIANEAVKKKKTTWEKLEREGKVLASKKPRRDKRTEWFVKGKVAAHG